MAGPDVRQCKDCGRLFQFYGNPFCGECQKKQDDYYVKVRDYIYEHPTADINRVAEETEVENKYIMQFLREGRLQFAVPEATGLRCESCGKPISAGVYCDSCKQNMAQTFGSMAAKAAPQPEPKEKNRSSKQQKMHIDLNKRER